MNDDHTYLALHFEVLRALARLPDLFFYAISSNYNSKVPRIMKQKGGLGVTTPQEVTQKEPHAMGQQADAP